MDISSDEEEEVPLKQSTPIKFFPLNVLQALNLNTESTVAKQGSETSPDNTTSIFESTASPCKIGIDFLSREDGENAPFIVENQTEQDTESSYFEEPTSPRKSQRYFPLQC